MTTILITGSSGFIATNFIKKFAHKYQFILVSHKEVPDRYTLEQIAKNDKLKQKIDIILNLAGENIGSNYWSSKRKAKILNSRVDTTTKLVDAFNQSVNRPYLISASAVGIYDFAKVWTEKAPIDYSHYANFSQEVTKKWEESTNPYRGAITIARFAPVLDPYGGALQQMLRSFRAKIAMQMGDGRQIFPWIALEDALDIIDYIIQNKLLGRVNVSAPQATTNRELTEVLANKFNTILRIKLPQSIIRLLFGQMGEELLLNGSHNYPDRLINLDYPFRFRNISQYVETLS